MIFRCEECKQMSVAQAFDGEHTCPWCKHRQTLTIQKAPRGLWRRTKRG